MNYQPMIDALADFIGFWAWRYMLLIAMISWLFGRARVAHWIEAFGWNGVRELLAAFGNSRFSQTYDERQAVAEKEDNVVVLPR